MNKFTRRLFFCAVLATLSTCGFAQNIHATIVPVTDSVTAGSSVQIQLALLNTTDHAERYDPPAGLDARLIGAGQIWPLNLRILSASSVTIPPRSFVFQDIGVDLPPTARGPVLLEISGQSPAPLRVALSIGSETSKAGTARIEQVSALELPASALSKLQRSFIGHFGEHDPMYMIGGGKAPAVKFQFSLKYRLLGFPESSATHRQQSVQLGYTQRSLWDVQANSSPFYDTSYMPSLFFESLNPAPKPNSGPVTWLGFQSGFQHESNGKAGDDSRSMNTLFVRPVVVIGRLEDWHATVSLKAFGYVGGLSDNPDIKDYRGYGEWTVGFGKNGRPTLTYTGRAGKDFDHLTSQFDLAIPLRTKALDFGMYFLVQYFHGYGESLRSYNQKQSQLRAGISLVR